MAPDAAKMASKQLTDIGSTLHKAYSKSYPYNIRHAERTTPDGAQAPNPNVLQMQVNDLFSEVKSQTDRRLDAAANFLETIKKVVELIPEVPPTSPNLKGEYFQHQPRITIPFAQQGLLGEVEYSVEYQRPVKVSLTGEFALGTAVIRRTEKPLIDLSIIMSRSLFQPKDYSNYRFFHKRAYFLTCIAAGLLRSNKLETELRYEFLNDNALQPVILASPLGDLNGKFDVRIIPVLESDAFEAHKTLPTSVCLRLKHGNGSEQSSSAATSLYNGTIRAECTDLSYQKLLHASAKLASGFTGACVLMSVWLTQRGMHSGLSEGGFGAYEASLLIALLLQSGKAKSSALLSCEYNSFQLFKAILSLLHEQNFCHDPLVIGLLPEHARKMSFTGSPTVWDAARSTNILYKMSESSYAKLKSHAAIAVYTLQSSHVDSFKILFLQNVTDAHKIFDDWFVISQAPERGLSGCELEGAPRGYALSKRAYSLLKEALGDRAAQVEIKTSSKNHMKSLSSPFEWPSVEITVGLVLNPQHLNRTVDRGPFADDKAAAQRFRELWNGKSELRRFQDGSIMESLIWQDPSCSVAIHRQVIEHICREKLELRAAFRGSQPLGKETSPIFAHDTLYRMNNSWKFFEEVRNLLQNLSAMPLHLRNFTPSSFHLGDLTVATDDCDVLQVCLELEGSLGWPESLKAIRFTKVAILARLLTVLKDSHPRYEYRLGLDETQNFMTESYLDVTSPNMRVTLRVQIFHAQELDVLSSEILRHISLAQRRVLNEVLMRQRRMFIEQPEHLQAMRKLSLRMPLLLPSLMLFRKWCVSHLLTDHLSTHFMDLVVTHVFTSPYPYSSPANVQTALIRTWELLTNWDWENDPLFVILNDEEAFPTSDAHSRYEAWQKTNNPSSTQSSAYLISNLEISAVSGPCQRPSKIALTRLIGLARASQLSFTKSGLDVTATFATGLSDFDVVIFLKAVPDEKRPGDPTAAYKNLRSAATRQKASDNQLFVRMFIGELIRAYSDALILFHNWGELPVIAGFWTPSCRPRRWKIGSKFSIQLAADADNVEANCHAILHDIARLGSKIIERIELRNLEKKLK